MRTTADILGVELFGGLKNVVALAAGFSEPWDSNSAHTCQALQGGPRVESREERGEERSGEERRGEERRESESQDGLGFPPNTKAAILRRGLQEMARLIKARPVGSGGPCKGRVSLTAD